MHWKDDCKVPADVVCHNCSKVGHLAKICRSLKRNSPPIGTQTNTRKTNIIDIFTVADARDEKFIKPTININGQPTQLIVDTGAKLTIISKGLWDKLGAPKLQQTDIMGKPVVGRAFKFLGYFTPTVDMGGAQLKLDCYVQEAPNVNLLGFAS
jgi:hypothetical protein